MDWLVSRMTVTLKASFDNAATYNGRYREQMKFLLQRVVILLLVTQNRIFRV